MPAADRAKRLLATLVVRRAPRLPGAGPAGGHLAAGPLTLPCALGNTSVTRLKREGDGGTPVGAMRVLFGYYRADRMPRPFSRIPLRALPPDLVWCDDPGAPRYNRPAPAPLAASHETMRRADGLYDIVLVLDWNMSPRRAGCGSAIFFHCARPGFPPTLGCVAIRREDMRRLLPRLAGGARLVVV